MLSATSASTVGVSSIAYANLRLRGISISVSMSLSRWKERGTIWCQRVPFLVSGIEDEDEDGGWFAELRKGPTRTSYALAMHIRGLL
jgi:hypothetical protein